VQSDTNTFKDAVQDMTIKALAISENDSGTLEEAKVTIDFDRDSVTKLVDDLIANYNNLIGQIGLQTRPDKGLNGDSSMRSFSEQLISTLSSSVDGAGPFETIFDIGIGVDKKGYLEKSSLVRSLNEAMEENFDDIGTAFAGQSGVAKKMEELLGNYVDSDGLLKERENLLNAELRNIKQDKIDHEEHIKSFEEGLRQKYAGLDVLLARMRQTQSYLGAQLSNLPGFTKSK
jgi:flagellar hook-associated protein 2